MIALILKMHSVSGKSQAASAGVTHPAKQGLIQTLGVFTDTLIVCTSTAFIIILWDLADLFMGVMAIINLIALTLLDRIAIAALRDYRQQKKEGKDPVFYSDSIEGLKGIESWDPKPNKKKRLTDIILVHDSS